MSVHSRRRWNFDAMSGPWRTRSRYVPHEDKLLIETTSVLDSAVADAVRQMQNDGRRHGLGSFAGDWHCIPLGVWREACLADPEMSSPDRTVRDKAVRRFIEGEGRRWLIPTGHGYVQGGLAH